jgi:hypothetical protein
MFSSLFYLLEKLYTPYLFKVLLWSWHLFKVLLWSWRNVHAFSLYLFSGCEPASRWTVH